jgi:hypothetical protein
VDDTNLDPKHEKSIRELVKGQAQVIINDSFLQVPVEECIARDALRGEKSVGEKVIRDMAARYLRPKEVVSSDAVVQDSGYPKVYIFDIDGTLAKFNGRSPHEYDKVLTDVPNKEIIRIYSALVRDGYDIIICSGRPEKCREATEEWLRNNNIVAKKIYMRPDGDDRNDAIIKREFLDDIVKKYYVRAVFDDRDRVVKMWRDAGLTCLQVNYGNF